jgi:hypothetical protein
MAQQYRAARRVDPTTHYYAVSVSYRHSGLCVLHATMFVTNPRHLGVIHLAEFEAPYAGPREAYEDLVAALDHARPQWAPKPPQPVPSGQLALPLE